MRFPDLSAVRSLRGKGAEHEAVLQGSTPGSLSRFWHRSRCLSVYTAAISNVIKRRAAGANSNIGYFDSHVLLL